MSTPEESAEDAEWRSIVDNYGERPILDDSRQPVDASSLEGLFDRSLVDLPRLPEPDPPGEFVPPAPAPVPLPSWDRTLAWLGCLGVPAVPVVAVLTGTTFPAWMVYLLIAWALGGFGYLVFHMPTGPRDPGDDGARI